MAIWARGIMGMRGAVAAALLVAGCAPIEPEPGAPDISRLQKPLSGEYLQLVSVGPRLVEIDAAGRRVKAAATGRCIPLDSIRTSRASVFLILAECPGAAPEEDAGLLSVSVSPVGLPMSGPALVRFLRSPEGLAALGHGEGAAKLVLAADAPEATYAVVEDRGPHGPSFAGPLIARAFTEINGRMVVATLLSLRDSQDDPERLRARLADLVARLRAENA